MQIGRTVLAAALFWSAAWTAASAREAPRPPEGAPPASAAIVSTRALTEMERFGGTALEGNPNFVVSGGRGSAALGVAFGPLGVAANMGHIRSVNRERGSALGEHADTNPIEVLREMLGEAPQATPAYEIAPVVLAHFNTETTFVLTCALYASLPGERRRGWRTRYMVWMDGQFDRSDETSLAAAAASVRPCLVEAHRLFQLHLAGGDDFGAPVQFQSGIHVMTQPLYQGELAAGRFVGGDPSGLTSYQRTPLQFFPPS